MDEYRIPKLDGENFNAWSIRTRAALVQKNFWEAIEPGYGPELKEDEKKKNESALTFLFLVVEDQFLDDIADCTRAKDAWNSLKDIHTKYGLLHTLQLLRELFNTSLKPDESINSYLGRLMDLHRKVSAGGYGLTDREVALVMLMGLPKKYEGLILNLERDEQDLSTRFVKSRLIVEEKKMMRYDSEVKHETLGERALKTKEKGTAKIPATSKRFFKKGEKQTRCFSCGEWGHIARNCPGSRTTSQVKMVSNENYQALFVNAHKEKPTNHWYIDSGATEHMCSIKEKFINLTPLKSKVEVANSEKMEITGTGDILLKPKAEYSQKTIFLANVLYVPELDGNLLSVGRIEEMGLSVNFEKGKVSIMDPKQKNKIILTGYRFGRLYKIEEEQAHIAYFSKEEKLMHRRLGHFHMNAIKKLKEEDDSTTSNETVSEEGSICSTCILGKFKKIPFPKGESNRASRPLELIHSDVAGPITPTSRGGSKYIVTFVDDYSRYTEVKVMKSKSEVLKKFIEFKTKVENFHGVKITSVRSDNGGEYISKEFNNFLAQHGISRQLTVPRTPEQNGIAEKMNHTLFDMTRCLLLESEIPNELWADAVTTACYLRNKCPSKAVQGRIPEELWTNKPVQHSHLKVFGCKAYALIDKTQQKGKLGKRSQECVFIGYVDGVKGYKLWNLEEDKIFVSRNVKFDETVFPLRRSVPITQLKEKEELIFYLKDDDSETKINSPNSPDFTLEDVTAESEGQSERPNFEDDEEPTNNKPETHEIRRSNRVRKPKFYYGDPILYKAVNEVLPTAPFIQDPTSVTEALKSPHAERWKAAMEEELNNLYDNQTWELVGKPANIKPIGCKWIFKKKLNADGEIMKFKARLVAKGYSQIPGKDFSETFSPVIKIKSLRILLALAVELDMKIHQMDITAAYLNGTLNEDVYMFQPEGFQEEGKEHLVCHLKRSLYGLKQSGREWNKCFDTFLKSHGLSRSKHDPCIYFLPDCTLYIGIYVDDMLIVGKQEMIDAFKLQIMQRFKAKDLGEADEILSMKIIRQADGSLTLNQTAYIEEILETYNASTVKGASTPLDPSVKHNKIDDAEWNSLKESSDQIPYRQAIGSLLYLSCGSRPDISFSVTYMSQFNERPSDLHWRSVKHLFRYLKETKHLSLKFRKTGKAVEIFSDADWGSDNVDRKSFSGYVTILGGAAVSWSSKKQCCTALSSAEAEYLALAHATKEVLWMKGLLEELGTHTFIQTPVPIMIDSQAAIFMAKNQTTSERSKHIDIKYHFIRDCIEQNVISLKYIPSKENVADLLTKNISKKVLTNLRKYLGFCV